MGVLSHEFFESKMAFQASAIKALCGGSAVRFGRPVPHEREMVLLADALVRRAVRQRLHQMDAEPAHCAGFNVARCVWLWRFDQGVECGRVINECGCHSVSVDVERQNDLCAFCIFVESVPDDV